MWHTIGGDDYHTGPYTAVFPAGETEVSFNVTIYDDEILESNETFLLRIISDKLPTRINVNLSEITVIIRDDDRK